MDNKSEKMRNAAGKAVNSVKHGAGKGVGFAKSAFQFSKSKSADMTTASLAFLSMPELLKWSENVTQSAATIYDKALDAEYLRTHIGGGNHRMFDGGHDLATAWDAVASASEDDSTKQEVVGYMSAIWKDVTTEKGLPFVTWSKDSYDASADWLSSTVPFVSKSWFYDLMSFDVFELLSSSLGIAGLLFALSKRDIEKLSEILGSMGIVAIISANPLMGLAVVFCTAHTYASNKRRLNRRKLATGAGMAGLSIGIFSVLGLPLLIELGIVLVVSKIVKQSVLENDQFLAMMKQRIATMPKVRPAAGEAYVRLKERFSELELPNRLAGRNASPTEI